MSKMSQYDATMIAEGEWELAGIDPNKKTADELQDLYYEAYQYLVDTGLVWQLQGFFGRQAMYLASQGFITIPNISDNEGIA